MEPSKVGLVNGEAAINKEDIVISGISGRFPESTSVEEFKENLYNGVDMVTSAHESFFEVYKLCPRYGRIKNKTHFDASFFGVHAKQVECMEYQQRMLLEVAYEAVVDAGLNPNDIRGTRTGVFVALVDLESAAFIAQDAENLTGYEMLGGAENFYANRISYCLDLKGPSCATTAACAGSMFTLQQAFNAIKYGQCDAAIVAGVSSNKPKVSAALNKLEVLSPEGKCKSFDCTGDGYVRSDCVAALYLQKAGDSRRIYATVLGVESNNDGYKEIGIGFPSTETQAKLMEEVLHSAKIKPENVSYVEAHAAGTAKGDPEEINAIVDAYCTNRTNSLLVGSVKSNMGHAEAGAGVCALIKVILAMENECIPGNLHFKSGYKTVPGLHNGQLQVVTENLPWKYGIAAINGYGCGGVNVNALLKPNSKLKPLYSLSSNNLLPRIVGISGRTEEAVNYFLSKIKQHRNDKEFLGLVDKVHQKTIPGHPVRGYILLNNKSIQEIERMQRKSRPIVFVYSGLGSQWNGMAKDLMNVKIFKESIERCMAILKPYKIHLDDIFFKSDDVILEDIVNVFVGIIAVQIALTDVLNAVGINPDIFVGHSLGEIGCAYADGSLTREQAILAAYYRGLVVVDNKLSQGAMAAVGLTWEEAQSKCSSDTFPVCHNSENNVTISGPTDSIERIVKELRSKNVFAKVVKSLGRAFHSKYVASAGPKLLSRLKDVIPDPKRRTSKWISSSVPESKWSTNVAQLSSPEYFVNNFLSPVLFYEALQHIPEDAIVIEIAPHGLMQPILKRTLEAKSTNISLMKKGPADNTEFFLSALGKIYNTGVDVNFGNLYDPVCFPVSKGTPMINSMIKWDHSVEWKTDFAFENPCLPQLDLELNINKESDWYLRDHIVEGHVIVPPAWYLVTIWKTFAKIKNRYYENVAVSLENIKFHKISLVVPTNGILKFKIDILEVNGDFELCQEGTVIVTGKISISEVNRKEPEYCSSVSNDTSDLLLLNNTDIYKELYMRGFEFKSHFTNIMESDSNNLTGKIRWNSDWVTFIDAILQFFILGDNCETIQLPSSIESLIINPHAQSGLTKLLQENEGLCVNFNKTFGIIKSGGVELRGIQTASKIKAVKTEDIPKLKEYEFVPYESKKNISTTRALTVMLQIALENNQGVPLFKIAEVSTNSTQSSLLALKIKQVLHEELMVSDSEMNTNEVKFDLNSAVLRNEFVYKSYDLRYFRADDSDLIIVNNLTDNDKFLENLVKSLKADTYVLLQEAKGMSNNLDINGIEIISKIETSSELFHLVRKTTDVLNDVIVMHVPNSGNSWIEAVKLKAANHKIYLIVEGQQIDNLFDRIKFLMLETGNSNIKLISILDKDAPRFTIKMYESQLKKDLAFNILRNGVWGSFRYFNVLAENKTNPVEHAWIKALLPGNIGSLKWVESSLGYCKNYKNMVYVYYSCVNLQDISLVVDEFLHENSVLEFDNQECILGKEFSGIDYNGKRVMGLVKSKALATTLVTEHDFLWNVPDKWSLEDAATIPLAYTVSYYALILQGQLKPKDILLVIGVDIVNLACLTIASHLKCSILVTVNNKKEKELLKTIFPQLNDNHIGNLQEISLEHFVISNTNGRGVDVLISDQRNSNLLAFIRCLAPRGRLLELGQNNNLEHTPLNISARQKNITVHTISLDGIFSLNISEKQQLIDLLKQGIISGPVQPLPRITYKKDQLEQAFQFVVAKSNTTKVLIEIREDGTDLIDSKTINALRCIYMDPEKSYIVVGGLMNFGLELANWLVNRGATKIILVSKNNVSRGYESRYIRKWKEKDVNVCVFSDNISIKEDAKKLFDVASQYGPVGGIFNLVYNYTNFSNGQLKCKMDFITLLDEASRELSNLDHFVTYYFKLFDQNDDQDFNDVLKKSGLERIIEERKLIGLPGTMIEWKCAVSDETINFSDIISQENSCLSTFDVLLQQRNGIFMNTFDEENDKKLIKNNSESLIDLIARILGFNDATNIHTNIPLVDLGVDSLMITEIQQILDTKFGVVLKVLEVRLLTFEKLADIQKTSNKRNKLKS